uniref:Iron complex ABC transporter substrate-binding protein n=1 Tax=uncultured archaeon W5-61a TaxID=1131008 RepID=H9BX86_9ARCH|nr:iron complex ABC transporter substrate-binding protein [uncultured archaeon W5-61a]
MVSRAVIGGVVVVAIVAVAGLLAFSGMIPGLGGPRAEGTVLVYGSIDAEDIQPVIDAFEAANPDIRIEYIRGSPSELFTRITTELDAGAQSADLTLVSFPGTLQLIREDVYRTYRSPEAAAYPADLKAPDGLWTSVILLGQVIVYNTDLVPPEDLPKTLSDLTDPKWNGKIIMHDYSRGTTSTQIWGSMAERIGEEAVVKFLTDLEANVDPSLQRRTGIQTDDVASGEFHIGIVAQLHDVVAAKLAGAPIEILQLEDFPLMQSPTPAAILKTGANPRATEIFVDFLLSDVGQETFGNVQVRFAAKPGVSTRFTVPDAIPAGMDIFPYPTQDVFDNIDTWTEKFRVIAGV